MRENGRAGATLHLEQATHGSNRARVTRSKNPRGPRSRSPTTLTVHAAPAPTIQIFGFLDCQDTRKAQRFFAERRLTVHFVNMKERPPSKGELRRFVEKLDRKSVV